MIGVIALGELLIGFAAFPETYDEIKEIRHFICY